jgi:sortilin (neurotensin receptor 3)
MPSIIKIISALLTVAVTAPVGNCLQDTPRQPIRLQKFSRDLNWLREEKLLQVGFGILPLDKETVLLFGSLGNGAATFGSLMLRSEDGGRNWTEVMAPVRGSGIWEVVYTETGLLWALVVWQNESPAEVRLYKSEDKGKTWRRVAKLHKRYYDGAPENLRFADDKHGLIEMYYGDHAGPEHEGVWTMETKDGGRTWHETGRMTLAECEVRQKKEQASKDSSDVVRGRDGSDWRLVWELGLTGNEPEQIHIRRRLPGEESWNTMCGIARDFDVLGMEIIERQVKK